MSKLSWVQQRTVNSAIKPFQVAVGKKDIGEQAKLMIRMIKEFPNYTAANCRSSILKDSGLPADIRKLRKKEGWSDYDIIEHYWSFEQFRELWTEYLDMDKENFVFCVKIMSKDKNWDTRNYGNKLDIGVQNG